MTDIRIGTSGFHYKHWIGRYYPADIKPGGMLAHYLRDFDTVELNNTFYQLPKEESFDAWRKSTPHDFLYAVKGSRFITHMIKLKDPQRGLANFLPRAERLRWKLGPILWQLPPKWNVNVERLESFSGAAARASLRVRAAQSDVDDGRGVRAAAALQRRVLHLRAGRLSIADRDHRRLDLHPPARTDAVQVPGKLQRRTARRVGRAHPEWKPPHERDLRLLRQRRLGVRREQRADKQLVKRAA
jgi:uncharacterized protein YecE (DUF72 family)